MTKVRDVFTLVSDIWLAEDNIDAVSSIIVAVDKNDMVIEINKAGRKIVGYERNEIIGKNWIENFVPEDHRNEVRQYLNRMLAEELQLDRYENLVLTRQGERKIISWHNLLLRQKSGEISGVLKIGDDVTESKQTEQRYRTVVRTAMDGFWLTDMEGHFLDVNDSYSELIGYSRAELLNMSVTDVEAAETAEETDRHIRKIISTEHDRFETLHRRKDGQVLNIEVSVNFLSIEGGRLFVFLRNITARKKAESTLKTSEENYRSLFNNMTEGFAECEVIYQDGQAVDWIYLEVNYAFEKITGLKNAAGKSITSLIPGIRQSNPELFEKYARVAESGKPERFESYVPRLKVWFSVSVYSTRKGYFVAVFDDINERKRLEINLRENEAQLKAVFDNADEGLVVSDLKGQFLFWNNAAMRMAGFSTPEEANRKLPEFQNTFILADKDGNVLPVQEWPLARILRGEILHGLELHARIMNRGWDRIWEYGGTIMRTEKGEPFLALVTVKDITEQKKAEAELKLYSKKLEESNDQMQQFVYTVSHDLREPLRMVASFSQALKKHLPGELNEKAAEDINFIVGGAARMQGLLDDLLVYSRISTQAQPFRKVDMEVVFRDVIDNIKISIEENHAAVTHDTLPEVQADPAQIAQVLQNLISNAIKFHRKGERPVVHVSCKKDAEWQFAVKDNGIGIDPDLYSRLFVIFSRLKPQEEYPGTGMGLAITKRIVQRHGGRVWVESQPGKGSTFYFTLAFNPGQEETAVKESV